MSRLLHLLVSHDVARTGVPRFSQYFQKAFPRVVNITLADLPAMRWAQDDVVITDNHMSVCVPGRVQTVVVHHGCAPYHYEVDSTWRNSATEAMATAQRLMFHVSNRIFVAPSKWVGETFRRYAPSDYDPLVLPHWVPIISGKYPDKFLNYGKPVVIGDWRNFNKGAEVVPRLRLEMPEVEFVQLDFSDRKLGDAYYLAADAYLCLSLSEGAPYSVADAEAAGLPIASTGVGNVYEFEDSWLIEDREKTSFVCDAVRGALGGAKTRGPSFFEKHNFESWKAAWSVVIGEAEKRTQ